MAGQHAEVLQEFLVSLGFHLDSISEKKFDNTMGKVLKSSLAVSKGVLGVAASAQAMVLAVTYEFEKLLYASKRIGDSAKNVQAYGYAVRQLGINTEDAVAALEEMAETVKYNPGKASFLEALIGGKAEGTVESMIRLLKTLRDKPPMLQAAFGEQFGLSKRMLTMFMQPGGIEDLEKGMQERKDINRSMGVDPDKMAQMSKEYQQSFRQLVTNFDTLAVFVTSKMVPTFEALNTLIMNATKWFTKTPDTPNPIQRGHRGEDLTIRPEDLPVERGRGRKTATSGPTDWFKSFVAWGPQSPRRSRYVAGSGGAATPPGLTPQPGWTPATGKAITGPTSNLHIDNIKSIEREMLTPDGRTPMARKILGEELANEKRLLSLTQNNNITVNTPANADAITKGVGKELDRTTGDLIRNTQGALN